MWRWNGCTQPPPPLRISHTLKLFFFCWAKGVLPAPFFMLFATLVGSNGTPLISHSISPPAAPPPPSKIDRFATRSFQFAGRFGRGRMAVGITLLSSAMPDSEMTNFMTGTLNAGSGVNREELLHIRP